MPKDDCCDKSTPKEGDPYKCTYIKSNDGEYKGEPDYLSAYHYNQLLINMSINKNNLAKPNNFFYNEHTRKWYKIGGGGDKLNIKKPLKFSSVNVPKAVESGTNIKIEEWNNTCDQIKTLINDAKYMIEATESKVDLSVNAAEVDAYKYSSGEVIKASKSITHLINLVRRARIHCYCNAEKYTPYNHCSAHTCYRDQCCDKSRD